LCREGEPIDAAIQSALAELLGPRVRFDEPLARHTSLRVGGPADALARPATAQELERLTTLCREHGAPLFALGRGFNTLVRDGGVRGVVVVLSELRELARDEHGHTRAGAGAGHSTVTRFCETEGLTGLEFAVGIPGTVGGWIAMNAGVPGREMKDVVIALRLLDPAVGQVVEQPASALAWHYRRVELPDGALVVEATFATEPGERERIRAEMQRHLEHRKATQPVNEPSCGSVFKNPEGERAGRLIEAAGLKGRTIGGATISPVHANFIVTRPGATAADVLALIDCAREEVRRLAGAELETEVRIVGEENRT
jgi:UDP-N-acetylmuramate dehydrogenase